MIPGVDVAPCGTIHPGGFTVHTAHSHVEPHADGVLEVRDAGLRVLRRPSCAGRGGEPLSSGEEYLGKRHVPLYGGVYGGADRRQCFKYGVLFLG